MPDGRSQALLTEVGQPSQLAENVFQPAATTTPVSVTPEQTSEPPLWTRIDNEGRPLDEPPPVLEKGITITRYLPGREPEELLPPMAGG